MKLNIISVVRATRRALATLCVVGVLGGCNDQIRARQHGGTARVDIVAGQKVVNASWKEANLWILTRPAAPDEKPETLTYHESSAWGVYEGTIVLQEHAAVSPTDARIGK